ncbi:Uma2 family endonuclease [Lacunimicrobium album]
MSTGFPIACTPVRKFTHKEYERLHDEGFIHPDERTELIRGEIRSMQAIGAAHMIATGELGFRLESGLPRNRFGIVNQGALRLKDSTPQPDIYVIRGSRHSFGNKIPEGAAVCLLVEVADSSLAVDRGEKLGLYAENQISEYWIVNLIERQVEVMTGPYRDAIGPWKYNDRIIYTEDQSVTFQTGNDSVEIPVSSLMIPVE